IVVRSGEVLLEQRAPEGIWGGLLSLPEVAGHAPLGAQPDTAAVAQAAARFGAVEEVRPLLPLTHQFTHYKLHMTPYDVVLADPTAAPPAHQWWPLARIADAPLPAPVKKLLTQLGAG
ncbi:MAG TPA: NUDIX domain-containing protein, partial [Telluria sp.]|nr:NUDIX domain-containing protein [Telluria sp.]